MTGERGDLDSVERGPTDVEQVVAAQRRSRRLRFWLGFVAIVVFGGLWAGLTTDPLGPGLFGGDDAVFDAPAVEIGQFEDFDVPETTVAFEEPAEEENPSETVPPDSTTTGP